MIGIALCEGIKASMMVAWCLLALSSCCDLVAGIRREKRSWVLLLTALFVLGGLLRVWLATWGPGDDQYRYQFASVLPESPLEVACRLDLGSAPGALWTLLWLLLRTLSDELVVVATLLMGSLAPVLLALFADLVGFGRLGALAAGTLLAVQPIAIRWSGTMGRSAIVLFLATLALWSLARARPRRSIRALVVFVLSAWLCARTRPEAGLILVVAGLAFLAFRLDLARRHRDPWSWLQAISLVFAGALGALHLSLASQGEGAIAYHLTNIQNKDWLSAFKPESALWADSSYTSVSVMALFAVGLVFGLWRARRATLWASISLVLVALAAPPVASGNLMLTYTRYQALSLLLFCAIAGGGAGMVVQACASMLPGRSKAVAGVLLLAVVLLASGGQLSRVCRPVTIEHEYHFLKDALPKLPSCAVVFRPFEPDEDLSGGFRDTDLLARGLDNVTWRGWPLAAPPNGCSAYFYRSPLCQVAYVSGTAPPHYPGRATVHERCLEGARRSKDRPLLSAELPALVWGVEQYRDDTVVIGFYELRSASQAHDPP